MKVLKFEEDVATNRRSDKILVDIDPKCQIFAIIDRIDYLIKPFKPEHIEFAITKFKANWGDGVMEWRRDGEHEK